MAFSYLVKAHTNFILFYFFMLMGKNCEFLKFYFESMNVIRKLSMNVVRISGGFQLPLVHGIFSKNS
jgi:hypothetical protein